MGDANGQTMSSQYTDFKKIPLSTKNATAHNTKIVFTSQSSQKLLNPPSNSQSKK